MRKPYEKTSFCICENNDADQLRSNYAADQRFCFRYTDCTILVTSSSYLRNFKPQAILCGCTAWFVWGQVRNPEDRFSHNEAHYPIHLSNVLTDHLNILIYIVIV